MPVQSTPAECECGSETAGIVGFNTDMGATKVGQQGDATSGTIATVRAGMQEIEQRWAQPFRHSLLKYLLPVRMHPALQCQHRQALLAYTSSTYSTINRRSPAC